MIKCKIIGTGSFLPDIKIGNKELFDFMGITKDPGWLVERFGIEKRRFSAFDLKNQCRPKEYLTDTDLAEKAVRAAISNSGVEASSIDQLIYVTCTPDKVHFMYPGLELHRRLGLRPNTKAVHFDSGCAGLTIAFEAAEAEIQSGKARIVVVVASNCTSAQFVVGPKRYMEKKQWLSSVVFGDGAGALVLESTLENKGILRQYCEIDGSHPLVDFPAGGALYPTTENNIDDHLYMMFADDVRDQFPVRMRNNLDGLGITQEFLQKEVNRVYVHQANRWLVEGFASAVGLPLERVPINIHKYGNVSAASTLILLDEDRKNSLVKDGDQILFLWVGGGLVSGGALVCL